ncbi:alpha-2-macroglobulin [Bacteroidales bacterium OttesenSCG-928-M06]|nr:alpha-2-macroglobulin [Bacteroidales bacterium OttesenSCG-928-M06]
MKRYFLIFVTLVCMNSMYAQYEAKWEQVQLLEKQSLPKSALEVVSQIYNDALKKNNSAEVIKTIIYQLKFETAIDQEKYPEMIKEIEKFTANSKDRTEQAVLYSLLANLYNDYYFAVSPRTTAISGYIPEDIREWPANLFIEKTIELVDLSLNPIEELQKTLVLKYETILTKGESSRNLRPTLYDFLVYEGISILSRINSDYRTQNYYPQTKLNNNAAFTPVGEFIHIKIDAGTHDLTPKILSFYQQLLIFRSQENQPQALLMADLDRLNFVSKNYEGEIAGKVYLEALNALKNKYSSYDYVVEVLYDEVRYYQNYFYESDSLKVEARKKAYDICTQGIQQYPKYERIGLLENFLYNTLLESSLNVSSKNVIYPGEDLSLNINYQNYDKIYLEIYSIKAPVSIYSYQWERGGQYNKTGTLVGKETISLSPEVPYLSKDTIISIPVKEIGNYEFVIKTDESSREPINKQFSVSRIGTVSRSIDNKRDFLVVDRISGKPIKDAQVNVYTRAKEKLRLNKTFITDDLGLAQDIGDEKIIAYNVEKGEDKNMVPSSAPWISLYNDSKRDTENLNLFTDRGIYRPGQTVYFKGIAYRSGENSQAAVSPNKKYELIFRDANGKEIGTQQMTTNEYGSFAGEFIIPQGLLSGSYSIQSDQDGGFVSVQVEEYKRPTFDIKFDEIEKAYNFGDEIPITGNVKTFSGVNLTDATVSYKITRSPHWLYRGYFYNSVQVAQGNVNTKEDGGFVIPFIPEKAFNDKNNTKTFYYYSVEVTVTNSNGESQSATTGFNIGDKSMYFTASGIDGSVDKDNPKEIRLSALNLSGKKVDTTITYEIYGLNVKDKNKLDDNDNWEQGEVMSSGTLQSGEFIDKQKIQSLPSGKYRIIAKDTEERGEVMQSDFLVASKDDKKPPVPTYKWVMTPKTACAPREKAEIILGSSAKEVDVLFEIFKDKERLSASRFVLNNENRKIEIPFLESYGEGIVASFTYIKDEKFFEQSIEIRREEPSHTLDLKTEVFRNHLLPGQKEEWKISVRNEEGNPVLAEILAGMYDASLDKIRSLSWDFHPFTVSSLWTASNRVGSEFGTSYGHLFYHPENKKVPAFEYDSFNWFGFNSRNRILYGNVNKDARYPMYKTRSKGMVELQIASDEEAPSVQDIAGLGTNDLADNKVIVQESEASVSVAEDMSIESGSGGDVQIRQNFNETAFFYPQLKTNEAGETVISFTVPESNTTWKFMALAHTKDLKYGQLIKEAVSQKKLMISPNIPRFIREGDKMTISSSIYNLSEEDLSGTITLELLDPVTDAVQIGLQNASKGFSLEAGKTTSVSWSFEVPSGIELTIVKIVAQSASFSDGEQHLVPVLPNRMLVTESLPLNVTGAGTKEYTFEKLEKPSPTLKNYRLTLEYASNPAWYAIQALPSITTPQNENILSWFAAYYSNTLANHIVNATPKIKQIVDIWTKQGGDKETLLSNLEKNQELKNILLEETPWVMDANGETEQKQRLSLLFDLNRIANINHQTINKLSLLQNEDGGWAWIKGLGNSNVSITQWILYGLGELSHLDGNESLNEIKQMQTAAIYFIDKKFQENYKNLKKDNPKWREKKTISTYELEYLYVRSYYKEEISPELQEGISFYQGITKNYWANTKKLYDRALASIIMKRNGNIDVAQNIIKSLREHASHSPELGMYWANNNTYSFMSQSATSVHTFIMRAFNETGATAKEMDEMKLWLLKQKQTQLWESVPATVESIQILLSTGSDWLNNEGNVQIQLGKEDIDFNNAIPGTGYIKKGYDADSITTDMAKVVISKSDDGPSWGALYWQYFEDLDKITEAKTELNVEKGLFIEQVVQAGKTLVPVTENNPLKVGDKVTVRLTIRSNRDMEFVHLKDMRASCFEPVNQLSGNQWKQGLFYYQAPKDASMNFYFDVLPKGTYVIEYNLYVTASGNYSNGITTIQCLYAPEYVSHTAGGRITVE